MPRVFLACLLLAGSLLSAGPLCGETATTPQASASASPHASASPQASPTPREPQLTWSFVHVDCPYIAMTFDDGPSAKLTPKLLDLLAERHIKVTFFVLGENVTAHPEILQRAAREGHEIGSHSWSHPNLAKMSDEAVRRELRRTDDEIASVIGKRPTLFRPPYGAISARQKRWIHDEFGYRIILWEVDPLDWRRPGPSVVESRIVRATTAGDIVLSHDIHPGTIEAMPGTLSALAAKGFKFVTVSELISMARTPPPKVHAMPVPPNTHVPAPAPTPLPQSSPVAPVAPSASPMPSRSG